MVPAAELNSKFLCA